MTNKERICLYPEKEIYELAKRIKTETGKTLTEMFKIGVLVCKKIEFP